MKHLLHFFLVFVIATGTLISVNVAYKIGALAGIDACVDAFHTLVTKGQSI